jgi:hypothetical protein
MSDQSKSLVQKEDKQLITGDGSNPVQINTLDDLARLSEMFVKSGFFGDIKDAAQAGVKILAGMELDIPAMAAMREIHVFEGNTSLSGPLLAALIKRSDKYDYRIEGVNDEGAKISFYENGEHVGDSTFTMKDAKEAGLLKKQNWRKYKKDMYVWRALARGKRWYAPEIGYGSIYLKGEIPEDGSPNDEEWKGNAPGPDVEQKDSGSDADFGMEVEDVEPEEEYDDDLVPPEGTEVDESNVGEPDWESEINAIDHNLGEYEPGDGLKRELRDINNDVADWPTEPRKRALEVLDKHWDRIPDDEEYQKVYDKCKRILGDQKGEDIIEAIDHFKPQTQEWPDDWKEKMYRLFEKHKKRYNEWKKGKASSSSNGRGDSSSDMSWEDRMEKCINILDKNLEKSKGGVQPLQGTINNLGSAIAKADVTNEQMADFQRTVLPYKTIVQLRSTVNSEGIDENQFNTVLSDFVEQLNSWAGEVPQEAQEAHDMVLDEARKIADQVEGFTIELEDETEDEEGSTQMILPNKELESLPEDQQLERQDKLIENGLKTTRVVQDAINRDVLRNISGIGMKTEKKIQQQLNNLKEEIQVTDENPFE